MACVMNTCDETFAECSGITSLTLPVGIKSIGTGAFWGECSARVGWIEGVSGRDDVGVHNVGGLLHFCSMIDNECGLLHVCRYWDKDRDLTRQSHRVG